MNLQETLDKLKPYLIGFRYVEGIPLVDVVLKPNWVIPASKTIQNKKEDSKPEYNYHMLYSEYPSVTLDHLLDYVALIIKVNIEKEEKLKLLKAKVEELKVIFQNNPLEKLNQLIFSFREEKIEDNIDLDISYVNDETVYNKEVQPELTYVEPVYPDGKIPYEPSIAVPMSHNEVVQTKAKFSASDIDNYGVPSDEQVYQQPPINMVELSEEEREILEEEARGARNIARLKRQKEAKNH